MNRKQNSLMRFSRTERLAQLSEQEIVIEKKKREIQAKLEAQKKKETEEAFKKLEFTKEAKSIKPGFPKKPSSGNDCKKSSSREKLVEKVKVKESLTNAFSNDGTFLDQFKKLSQSGLPFNSEVQTLGSEKNKDGTKYFSDSNEENLSKGETSRKRVNESERDNPESHKKNKTSMDNNQLSFIKNSTNSGAQLQVPGGFQFPQQQNVQVLTAADNSKSEISLLTSQTPQALCVAEHSDFSSNNALSNSSQSNYFNSVPPVNLPKLGQNLKSKELLPNETGGAFIISAPNQPSVTSQSIPKSSPSLPSAHPRELPKVRSESISMTLKINPVKKLEAIPNPLESDQALSSDSVNKSQFSFSEKKSSESTFLNASRNFRSKPMIDNVSQDKESSRISSAFCNDDDDDDDDEEKSKNKDDQLNDKLQHWASLVAHCGDEFEDSLRNRNENDPDLEFLSNKNSKEYLSYRRLVSKYRTDLKHSEEEPSEKTQKSMGNISPCNKELTRTEMDGEDGHKVEDLGSEKSNTQEEIEKTSKDKKNQIDNDEHKNESASKLKSQCFIFSEEQSFSKETSSQNLKGENVEGVELKTEERRKRKRKSRWGDADPTTSIAGNLDLQPSGKLPVPKSTLLSQLTRSDPGLIQYARQTFGSTNLSEEDWKKAEDHYKINLLYQDMIKKRAEVEKLERQGKFKYEYDSDEDTEGGTWEHKLRQQEMQATQLWAEELTRQAAGKHHIGDFLPPEELERFMEKYNAVKEGREPDLSDYKEYKLKEDNVGYRLLQKMGWNEGQGLGQDGSGIVNPVSKGATRHENQGLGVERSDGLEAGDDEYDAYRKRMMLAYRFRPNPLNNPRRPYY